METIKTRTVDRSILHRLYEFFQVSQLIIKSNKAAVDEFHFECVGILALQIKLKKTFTGILTDFNQRIPFHFQPG